MNKELILFLRIYPFNQMCQHAECKQFHILEMPLKIQKQQEKANCLCWFVDFQPMVHSTIQKQISGNKEFVSLTDVLQSLPQSSITT